MNKKSLIISVINAVLSCGVAAAGCVLLNYYIRNVMNLVVENEISHSLTDWSIDFEGAENCKSRTATPSKNRSSFFLIQISKSFTFCSVQKTTAASLYISIAIKNVCVVFSLVHSLVNYKKNQ